MLGALLFLSNVVRLIGWGPDDKDPTAHFFKSIFLFSLIHLSVSNQSHHSFVMFGVRMI